MVDSGRGVYIGFGVKKFTMLGSDATAYSMFIIKSPTKEITIPVIAFLVSFSLNNKADIRLDRTSAAPWLSGYKTMELKDSAARVLKYEFKNKQMAMIRI